MFDFKPVKLKKHAVPAERRLYLVRCADASGKKRYADSERPLTGEGRKSLKKLCKYIIKNGISPDMILCSPARRGRETLEGVLTVLKDAEIVFLDALYTTENEEINRFINDLPPNKRNIMVIGHKTTLNKLAERHGSGKTKKLKKGGIAYVLAKKESSFVQD